MALLIILLFAIAALPVLVWHFFLVPPANFPRNIPTIPFYVSLIPFFKDVDQKATFEKYLAKPLADYGAVKYFFGARWNILVVRPDLIGEVLRNEDLYPKSGNQKKIPYSVLAEYTGDNIISSHGENWKLYRSILKPGLQTKFDIKPVLDNANTLIKLLEKGQATSGAAGIVAPPLLQRYTLANLSQSLLSTTFQTLERSDAPLHTMQLDVKREIFKPTFLSFPFLDLLPVPSRKRARQLVRAFGDELVRTVRHVGPPSKPGMSHLSQEKAAPREISLQGSGPATPGQRLLAAHDQGLLTPLQLRHNLVSVFLAGHENPQLLLVSAMYLLAKHPEAQDRLRAEILATGSEEPTHAMLENMPCMAAVVFEVLRLLPPISQLINRATAAPAVLDPLGSGGEPICIPEGTYVGYNAYATQHLAFRTRRAATGSSCGPGGADAAYTSSWGPDPDAFRPERWGATVEAVQRRYRDATRRAEFIAFHGGRRACLGERFGLLEGKVTLWALLRAGRWTLAEGWEDRMTPAGPLYPRLLRLKWEGFGDGRLEEVLA